MEHSLIGGDASKPDEAIDESVHDEEDSRGTDLRVVDYVLVNFRADVWGDVYGRVVLFDVESEPAVNVGGVLYDQRDMVKVPNPDPCPGESRSGQPGRREASGRFGKVVAPVAVVGAKLSAPPGFDIAPVDD